MIPKSHQILRYQGVSIVDVDEQGKIVACQMNYIIDEAYFNTYFVEYYRVLIATTDDMPASFMSYAKHRYQLWQGLDFFKRFNLKKVLYLESTIVLPEYRHKGLSSVLMNLSMDLAVGKCDDVLCESQIPYELYLKMKNQGTLGTFPKNSINLRNVMAYDKFYTNVELCIYKDQKVKSVVILFCLYM